MNGAVNGPLLRHTLRGQRIRLGLVCLALAGWGAIPPIVYVRFGSRFQSLFQSGFLPPEMARFGGGDIFSLAGAIALGLIHPISIILVAVFAVGFTTSAVAGERQRGTLENLLARPISRRSLYVTLAVATLLFLSAAIASLLAGSIGGAAFSGIVRELPVERLPLLWLNGVLLHASLASIGLAASVTFDRLPPALGLTLGCAVAMYAFEVLGSLWPAAAWLQSYSLFHYPKAKEILNGAPAAVDLAVLAGIASLGAVWALVIFPRRDIASPS